MKGPSGWAAILLEKHFQNEECHQIHLYEMQKKEFNKILRPKNSILVYSLRRFIARKMMSKS